MDKIRKSFFKYLVLVLFVAHYSGATMFYHTHNIGEGSIVHSHLYLGGEATTPGHCHSNASFSLISILASSLNFLLSALLIQSIFIKLLTIYGVFEDKRILISLKSDLQSRAPPIVS